MVSRRSIRVNPQFCANSILGANRADLFRAAAGESGCRLFNNITPVRLDVKGGVAVYLALDIRLRGNRYGKSRSLFPFLFLVLFHFTRRNTKMASWAIEVYASKFNITYKKVSPIEKSYFFVSGDFEFTILLTYCNSNFFSHFGQKCFLKWI